MQVEGELRSAASAVVTTAGQLLEALGKQDQAQQRWTDVLQNMVGVRGGGVLRAACRRVEA
jgi:hypothetical protein